MSCNNTHKSNRLGLIFFNKNKVTKLMFVNTYKTVSFDIDKSLGVTRHYPPASKEWKDSVYSYNSKYIRDIPFKDEKVSTIIRSHLSLIPAKKSTKSRRMRLLIRRSSTKNLFVSKPEIKQTSDRAIITIYLFDRQKQLFKNKLFMLHRLLLKNGSIFTHLMKKNSFSLGKKILKNVRSFHKRKILRNTRKRNIYLKKQMYKYRIKPIMFAREIMTSVLRKKSYLKSLFFFRFLKWALSIFNIEIDLKKEFLIKKNENSNVLNIKNTGVLSVNKLRKINIILLQYFLTELNKITSEKTQDINVYTLFKEFKARYYKMFMRKYLKSELLTLKILSKLNFNKRKSITMIDGLKNLISKIYSKKVELNLVNLKYLHLNSDNFSEAITTKLKKKTGRLLRVLKKSLKLVKKPRKFSARLAFSKSIISKPKDTWKNNIKNVLNSLKYKWVTGVRLEAKGRLTRRFTASRAVYKFKYKGNLRNLEHLYNTNYKAKSPSVFMLRNQFRPNTQHSYKFSNKRIGSFGIKGWISSV